MEQFRKLWKESKALTALSVVMLTAFALSTAGIVLDPRTITGVPAWLKPAKFAISIAIYAGTLAWMFQYITVGRRFVRWLGIITAAVGVIEIVIIDLQAARGTTSHFNATTPLDAALFGVMGLAILILWLASVGICVVLFRQPFSNRAWGWSLRLGMLITVIGSLAGGLMVHYGAHTMGAADGGAGLLGLGWSSTHGDLRIPHFFGLHGMQVIPLLYWLFIRNWRGAQTQFVAIAAASYFAFIVLLAIQALRGQSIIDPDGLTLAAGTAWLLLTAAAMLFAKFSGRIGTVPNAVSAMRP
ncbi:MAG: hypothetical protein JO028_05085 [Acidobacteriaceae bacterium]|nr:hypothetical protein [Acidobacteriaceae bacterium]